MIHKKEATICCLFFVSKSLNLKVQTLNSFYYICFLENLTMSNIISDIDVIKETE